MPNPIKYSDSAESRALKKGNFWIGTGDIGKGPTSTTGYWNGITPPAGGYCVYVNKASQGPSIHICNSDPELISFTGLLASQSFDNVSSALAWYNTQTDKIVINIDIPQIVTNGLTVNLDVTNVLSYPNSGNDWYDLSGNSNNAGLGIGTPAFSTFDGKRSIRFNNNGKFIYSPPYDGFVLSTNPGISSSGTSFTFEANQIVIATNANEFTKQFLPNQKTTSQQVTNVYFEARLAPTKKAVVVLNASSTKKWVTNLTVLSNVSKMYAPPGKVLVSVSYNG